MAAQNSEAISQGNKIGGAWVPASWELPARLGPIQSSEPCVPPLPHTFRWIPPWPVYHVHYEHATWSQSAGHWPQCCHRSAGCLWTSYLTTFIAQRPHPWHGNGCTYSKCLWAWNEYIYAKAGLGSAQSVLAAVSSAASTTTASSPGRAAPWSTQQEITGQGPTGPRRCSFLTMALAPCTSFHSPHPCSPEPHPLRPPYSLCRISTYSLEQTSPTVTPPRPDSSRENV